MVQRKTFPVQDGYNIAVASEQMRDGKWAAVATVIQSTDSGERAIDMPVSSERFETEGEAERVAVGMARNWIERNLPAAESVSPSQPE